MDAERLTRARAAMEAARLDAIVCRLPENVLLLSGHWPLIGWSFLVFPLEGRPTCIVPHCDEREAREGLWKADCVSFLFGVLKGADPYDEIARILKDVVRGHAAKRVGIEESFECVAPPWNVAEPVIPASPTRNLLENVFGASALADVTALLNDLRARKTPMEQEKLRTVNEIAAIGLEAFSRKVDIGVSGIELVAEVEHVVMTKGAGHKGARCVRAFAQVSTGPAETCIAYRPMVISTPRKLEDGDLAVLELAVVADGFWSDRTRVRVAGAPTGVQRKVHETVQTAQEAAIAAVRPGAKAGDVDEAARSVIRDAGYDDGVFLHVTGHGLGLRYHEPTPLICPRGPTVLEEGMVHTVEPGLYLPGMGGIRIEDNVLVTTSGSETLGPFAKEI